MANAQKDTISRDEALRQKRNMREDMRRAPKLWISINKGSNTAIFNYSLDKSLYAMYDSPGPEGFAKSGQSYGISAGMGFANMPAEILLSVTHTSNAIDANTFLANTYTVPFTSWINTGTSVINPNVSYEYYNALAGASYTIKADLVNIDFKLMLGYSYCEFPEMHNYITSYYGNSNPVLTTLGPLTYSSFAYDFGIGLKVFVGMNVFLTANIDIFGTTSCPSSAIVNFSEPVQMGPNASPVTQTTVSCSLATASQAIGSLGIGYAFPYQKKK